MASERDLRFLKRLDVTKSQPAIVAATIRELWNKDYGRATFRGGWLTLVTGGWSENEEIIANIPSLFYALCWWRSERGGLHVFKVTRIRRNILTESTR